MRTLFKIRNYNAWLFYKQKFLNADDKFFEIIFES